MNGRAAKLAYQRTAVNLSAGSLALTGGAARQSIGTPIAGGHFTLATYAAATDLGYTGFITLHGEQSLAIALSGVLDGSINLRGERGFLAVA
jgi:hypothetical protein